MISSTLIIWFQLDSVLGKIGLAIINVSSFHFCSVSWWFQKLHSNCSPKFFFWRRQLYVIQTCISWYFPSINFTVLWVHAWILGSASKKVTVFWKGVGQQTFTGFARKKPCLNRQKKVRPKYEICPTLCSWKQRQSSWKRRALVPRSHYRCGTQMTEVKNKFQDETAQCLTPLLGQVVTSDLGF